MEIKLTTKQAPFWVYWEYSGNKQQGQVTTCIINQEQTELVRGSVVCSKKDRYIKETGRKLAIKKCLDILPFSKEERKEFWHQYHSRIPVSNTVNQITYKKDGILIDEKFISLSEIIDNCNKEKVKEEKLLLLKMGWDGWRGFDEGILEQIVLPIEKIEIIKKYMFGKTIDFGEIAGKHSDVSGVFDKNSIEVIENAEKIVEFLAIHPNGHQYNYSFLEAFTNYHELSEEEEKEFFTIFNN